VHLTRMSEGDNNISVYIYNGVGEVPTDVTHVKVNPSVTVIPDNAFKNRLSLVEVELPEGLVRIGFQAFNWCKSLKRINIPSTVQEIEKTAFRSCEELEGIILPIGLRTLEEWAFYGCKSLKRINIPPSLKTVDMGAFFGCNSLTTVTINEGVQDIELDAFTCCGSLVSVSLPSTLKVIGRTSFEFNNTLSEIHMHDTVQTIVEGAFRGCNLQNFRIPPLVNSFDISILAENTSLVSFEIPKNVKDITDTKDLDDYDDTNMKSLRNIALPSECRTSAIPPDCLDGCEDLEEALPDEDLVYALEDRFDDLPIHKTCYYQSYHDTEEAMQNLKLEIAIFESDKNQDCLGMTPLHILACSTKPTIEMYRLLIEKYPETLTMKDKWGDVPLLYAFWCNVPSEVIDLLVESYKSNHPDYELDWKRMLLTMARRNVPLANIQKLVTAQQNNFPDQKYDMQQVVMELAAHNTNQKGSRLGYTPIIETFRYLLYVSITKRLDSLAVKRFQVDLTNSINAVSEKEGREEDTSSVYDRLAAYEIAKEGTSVLELALWKAKIDESRSKRTRVDSGMSYRDQCRINSGADIVIRNVLPFLLPKSINRPIISGRGRCVI